MEITLTVPLDFTTKTDFSLFTPDETAMMLNIGGDCICTAKKHAIDLFSTNVLQKEIDGQKYYIEQLIKSHDGIVTKEVESVKEIYNTIIDKMKRDRDDENKKYNNMIIEKDKRIDDFKATFEKGVTICDEIMRKKTNVELGSIGEQTFENMAVLAFRDFNGFELKNMHTFARSGDYHLMFEKFNILVDAKLYTNSVGVTERNKIKRDLLKHDHINFGWLISLETNIDKFDKAPIMFEWVSDTKCICYVNSLISHREPVDILRGLWFVCSNLNDCCLKIQDNMGDGQSEICDMKRNQERIHELLVKYQQLTKDRVVAMKALVTTFDSQDELIRMMLDQEANVLTEQFEVVTEWLRKHLKEDVTCDNINVTTIWSKFKVNKDIAPGISIALFRRIISSSLPAINVHKIKNGGIYICKMAFIE